MTEQDEAVKQMIINNLKPVITTDGVNITLTMDWDDSEKVNARLIAAAPDMFKAIGTFLEQSKHGMGSYDADDVKDMLEAYVKAGGVL